MRRGDVVLVDFPYTSGLEAKVRPAVVVQNDRDNQRLTKTVVAMVTGNVRRAASRRTSPSIRQVPSMLPLDCAQSHLWFASIFSRSSSRA